jgi:hypothetical protein
MKRHNFATRTVKQQWGGEVFLIKRNIKITTIMMRRTRKATTIWLNVILSRPSLNLIIFTVPKSVSAAKRRQPVATCSRRESNRLAEILHGTLNNKSFLLTWLKSKMLTLYGEFCISCETWDVTSDLPKSKRFFLPLEEVIFLGSFLWTCVYIWEQ